MLAWYGACTRTGVPYYAGPPVAWWETSAVEEASVPTTEAGRDTAHDQDRGAASLWYVTCENVCLPPVHHQTLLFQGPRVPWELPQD